jgi:hypothetical protein
VLLDFQHFRVATQEVEEVKRNEAKTSPSQRECCLAFRRFFFYLPKYKNDSVKRGGSISVLSERDEQHRHDIRKEKRNFKKGTRAPSDSA